MKIRFAALALSLVSASTFLPAISFAAANVQLFVGQKDLDDDDWKGIDPQLEIGVMTTSGPESWPVSIAADLMYSQGSGKRSGVKVTGNTTEINLGVRKIFDSGDLRPYVGGGLAYILAEAKGSVGGFSASESTAAPGFWANAGLFYNIGQIGVGAGLRFSAANSDKDEFEAELGGLHYGVTVGYTF